MKILSNKDSLVRQVLLLVSAVLSTLATLTVVSNFGWGHMASFIFYPITVLIYYIVYLLWKN